MNINLSFVNDSLCRVCLVEVKDKKPLDSTQTSDQRTLFEILNYVVNLNIKRDVHLPKYICINCEDILLKADNFKRQCLESEAIFDATLNNVAFFKNVLDTGFVKEKQDFSYTDASHTSVSNYQCSVCFVKLSSSVLLDNHIAVHNEKISALTTNGHMTPLGISNTDNINFNPIPNETLEKTELDLDYCIENNLEHYESDCSDINLSPLTIKQENLENIQNSITDIYEPQLQNTEDLLTQSDNNCELTLKNELDIVDEAEEIVQSKLSCHSCSISFETIEEKQKHKCKTKKRKDTVPNTKSKLEKNFKCNQCHFSFSTSHKLEIHQRKHVDINKYICAICKREFKYQSNLDKHFQSQHSQDQNYCCHVCPKTFATPDSLVEHAKKHSSNKEHHCNFCNKVFFMLSSLKDHLRIHTGEKPFLCSVCGKGFSQKNNMTQHMQRHLGLKPYKCDNCDQSFVSKGELVAHNRKHSGAHPFLCNVCGNSFTTSSSLVKHRRIHTGERPYACDLCPMRFAASSTLKNHKRSHSGEKPYQCSHCERAFVQRHDLISHIRCHTGERPYVCTECGQTFRKANALKVHGKLHVKEPVSKIALISRDGEV